jgi:predicted nucleotide-binding protein (sugar kinase/HSP70/actin superfamily)
MIKPQPGAILLVMHMTIGIPNALLAYRYGALWESFFCGLGCDVLFSEDTTQPMAERGIAYSVGECCLPLKVFLGHVCGLMGKCDYILVPRFEHLEKSEEFCVRFWGRPDIVVNTFPKALLLSYNLQGQKAGNELFCFLRMGRILGQSDIRILRACRGGKEAQHRVDTALQQQGQALQTEKLKILLAAQPYIIHDPWMGAALERILRECGAEPIFADRCERLACRERSTEITGDLYWTMNKEIIGAIPLLKEQADGVILITAFPCGTDSPVNELALRRVRDLPVTHLVLDEQQAKEGVSVSRVMGVWFLLLGQSDRRSLRQSGGYLRHTVGANGVDSVSQSLAYADRGYDGILHLKSFGCIPELSAAPALTNLSRDKEIPILSLSFDSHTSETGIQTRLEAFSDMLRMRKEGLDGNRRETGIDIGSVSTKGVVLDGDNRILASDYQWTESDPVAAAKRIVLSLQKQLYGRIAVRSVGTTGSARRLVGAMLGVSAIKNEITAHAVGTLSRHPDVRTILEIGGQDSKMILNDPHR